MTLLSTVLGLLGVVFVARWLLIGGDEEPSARGPAKPS
jgi:hypothetical protein